MLSLSRLYKTLTTRLISFVELSRVYPSCAATVKFTVGVLTALVLKVTSL
ncbi:hypothetical protein [Mycoplasmopsis synoviae]|nr:hypothetical protein [Mycoplasmopsis synoviae]